jgi:hypothetical protein
MLPRTSRLLLALVVASATAACDHEVQSPETPAAGSVLAAPFTIRGTVLDERLAVAAQAELVAEFVDAAGSPVGEGFATADARGEFEIDGIPEGAASVEVHVFTDGRHVTSRDLAIFNGQPAQRHLAIIFAGNPLCAAVTWGTAKAGGGSDKMMHCVASCRTVRWCGAGAGATAANLKERLDEACRNAPQWVKNLLSPVSGCGGWDAADMKANQDGFGCAKGPFWRTCERCCDGIY